MNGRYSAAQFPACTSVVVRVVVNKHAYQYQYRHSLVFFTLDSHSYVPRHSAMLRIGRPWGLIVVWGVAVRRRVTNSWRWLSMFSA